MSFSKIWKVVLAATLALWGLGLLDILTFDNQGDILGIGAIATAVLLILDK